MKQVTIHSDGFGGKNTVLVTEEGELVDNVIEASIQLKAGQVTEVTLVMQHAAVSMQGQVREVVFDCKFCDSSQLHYCDGMAPTPPSAEPAWPTPEKVAAAIQASDPITYTPCGAAFVTHDAKSETWTCYVHGPHKMHVDVLYGGTWNHTASGLKWSRLND